MHVAIHCLAANQCFCFSAMAMLIIKGIHFAMSLAYPLPGEDLRWKRAPSLPLQDLTKKISRKARAKRSPYRQKAREQEPLAHVEVF